jgi:hypothetical protein
VKKLTELEAIVGNLLDDFYRRRIEKINTLSLRETLARKNPYLYKAIGIENASDIVTEILTAYMSSSDEGIFGDALFEPLAEAIGGGHVAETEGVDVIVEEDNVYHAYAVKSGTSVFNADSRKKQAENFATLRSRVAKRKKAFDAVVGYGYGKKDTPINKQGFREVAGQVFWEELTGDPDFYLKIIDAMGNKPQEHEAQYQVALKNAVERFTDEFKKEFCLEDGSIDWEKIVKYNSGKVCKGLVVIPKMRTLDKGEQVQIEIQAIFSREEIYVMTGDLKEVTYQANTDDVVNIDENGLVTIQDDAIPGSQVKILVACYGRARVITIKVKQARIVKKAVIKVESI